MQFVEVVRDAVRHMMSGVARWLDKFSHGKITPNMITATGLVAHVFIAFFIGFDYLWLSAFLLIFFGLFDALDGVLARVQQRESTVGRLFDSVSDRLKEVLLYTAIGYNIINYTDRPLLAIWAILACGLALCVSYLNAVGDAAMRQAGKEHDSNKTFRVGWASFEIRIFILLCGLITGRLPLAVIVISVLAALTIWQRFNHIQGKLRVQD